MEIITSLIKFLLLILYSDWPTIKDLRIKRISQTDCRFIHTNVLSESESCAKRRMREKCWWFERTGAHYVWACLTSCGLCSETSNLYIQTPHTPQLWLSQSDLSVARLNMIWWQLWVGNNRDWFNYYLMKLIIHDAIKSAFRQTSGQ